MYGDIFSDLIASSPDATTVTIKHRSTEYFGNPTAVASSGGSFVAGTYYWRANPVKASIEYQMGDQTQLAVTTDQKVTLTLPNLGSGVTFNVYRSAINSLDFTTPSLLASGQAAGSYVDSGGAQSAGAPIEAAADPYVVWSETSAQCLRRLKWSATDSRALQEGLGPLEEYRLYFAPDESIATGDFVVMDGREYAVENVLGGLIEAGTTKVIVAQVQRGRLEH